MRADVVNVWWQQRHKLSGWVLSNCKHKLTQPDSFRGRGLRLEEGPQTETGGRTWNLDLRSGLQLMLEAWPDAGGGVYHQQIQVLGSGLYYTIHCCTLWVKTQLRRPTESETSGQSTPADSWPIRGESSLTSSCQSQSNSLWFNLWKDRTSNLFLVIKLVWKCFRWMWDKVCPVNIRACLYKIRAWLSAVSLCFLCGSQLCERLAAPERVALNERKPCKINFITGFSNKSRPQQAAPPSSSFSN